MPQGIVEADSVPYKEGFLLVGGRVPQSPIKLRTVYEYNPRADTWTELEGKLSTARNDVTAMIVKRNIFPECQGQK